MLTRVLFSFPSLHPAFPFISAVFQTTSEEDRQAFLAFSTGRSRLPSNTSGVALVLDADSRHDDARLPTASTCSYAFHIPAYSSAAVLRDRMLKAIYSCRAIDNDGSTQGLFGGLDAAAFAEEDAADGAEERAAAAPSGGDGPRWLRPLGPYFQLPSVGADDDDWAAADERAASEAGSSALWDGESTRSSRRATAPPRHCSSLLVPCLFESVPLFLYLMSMGPRRKPLST